MIFSLICTDLNALAGNSRLLKLKYVLSSHAFHMTAMYRAGCAIARLPIVGKFFRIVFEYLIRIIFSSDISLRSRIGPGLIIVHGHDIVIGANVVIGMQCKIFNGVTLGNKDTESNVNLQPSIGDNVILSTGCKVLGDVIVGSNSIVGANSVVLKNVPDNSIAVGVPAVIKMKRNI